MEGGDWNLVSGVVGGVVLYKTGACLGIEWALSLLPDAVSRNLLQRDNPSWASVHRCLELCVTCCARCSSSAQLPGDRARWQGVGASPGNRNVHAYFSLFALRFEIDLYFQLLQDMLCRHLGKVLYPEADISAKGPQTSDSKPQESWVLPPSLRHKKLTKQVNIQQRDWSFILRACARRPFTFLSRSCLKLSLVAAFLCRSH